MSGSGPVELRPLELADTDVVLDLWNRAAPHDPLGPALLREKIQGDDDYRPELALLAQRGSVSEGFAVAVVREQPEAIRAYIKMMAVHPEGQRRGTGSRLLAVLESALSERGAQTVRLGESLPNYLVPGVDRRYEGAARFFEKHGYRRFEMACNMMAELEHDAFDTADEEAELARAGVTVRRAGAQDTAAIRDFLQRHWPPWQQEVRSSMSRRPPALHLAYRGRELLAFSAFDGNNAGSGSFGPMGTAPEARGLGIGQVLLRRCLKDIKAAGFRRAIIPWVAPTRFYEQHVAAKITRRFYRYQKEL
jgi:ribosomal protein S18 acetylase RimI-like enzyme